MIKIIGLALVASYLWLFTPAATADPEQEAEWIYYVKKGDTLWDFCTGYLGRSDVIRCWKDVQRHNHIAAPKRIHPGIHLRVPISWITNIPVAAVVQFARGDVRQRQYGASQDIPVATGDQLRLGSRIIVADGGAVLRFKDGSELLLRHNSELFLQALTTHGNQSARSTLKLNRGSLDVEVPGDSGKKRFRILTPGAVAAVRGTEFRVTAKPDGVATQVEVLQGGVDVAAGGAGQLVPGGFGVSAVKGQPVQAPVKLLSAPGFDGLANRFDSDNVALAWQSVADARGYQLELYQGSSGEQVLYQHEAVDAQYRFANLPLGDYRLMVRAIADNGLRGLDSEPFQFQVLEKLAVPVLDGESASYKKKKLVVDWQAVDGAQDYFVEVSQQSDFQQILWSQQVSGTHLE
ncbi:MAG: FecR domain-containing protein, partial [Porticoccaceae bacterium]|nr:FecR domain-containing protein [Porticoccaceae bacterium]